MVESVLGLAPKLKKVPNMGKEGAHNVSQPMQILKQAILKLIQSFLSNKKQNFE